MRLPLFAAASAALISLTALAIAPTKAMAQSSGTSTGGISGEDLARLKEELKAELKAELEAEGAMTESVQDDSWAEEEWKWEEPVRPELNFLEIDGYFRFRYDMFKDLDLGVFGQDGQGAFANGTAPTVPVCNLDPECARQRGEGSTIGGANMRLRLEPVLNVYEDIKVKMQVDVLDNIVLGSTPDGYPKSLTVPLIAFSQTQLPPSDGVNALTDSVAVKRVWAEVMTPLGQLRFGRMPSHFGMGVLANGGQGLDSDFGDSNDRIMFATKIANHYIVPAFDWTVSGPTSATRGIKQGQPYDRDQRDDVDQYILAIARKDKDEEIQELLENDETVVNYGTYLVYRDQVFDAANYYAVADPNSGPAENSLVLRAAEAFVASLWFKLLYRDLSFEFEGVGIFGTIENSVVAGSFGDADPPIDIEQLGGAMNVEYKLLQDALTLRLLVVAATGDSDPGFGVQPLSDSAPTPGSWDGAQQLGDNKISNFRFDPDFHIDLILWRQLVGMVTDALVFRPGVQYNLTEGLGARLDILYSRTWFGESTLSAGATPGGNQNLGVETDLKLFYSSDDGFHAWLEYGILIPMAGLDRRDLVSNEILDAGVAQTIQAMLAVTF